MTSQPIRIHPQNPKIFEFRGAPIVLVTASEHYGSVMNRPFRYERYLADVAEKGINYTRLFVLFREQQTPINPYSTCKPESPDYVAPFERTGPGLALDEEPKYDLDRPNPEFYERLHSFISMASGYGVIVEVVLLSCTYSDPVWALNPFNAANNVNGLDPVEWPDYISRRSDKTFQRQVAHVRKIVTELNAYDNVLFEICNEPMDIAGGTHPDANEINGWLKALIQVVRETESGLPNKHLVIGQEAWKHRAAENLFEQYGDLSFYDFDYDAINMHPLPGTIYGGRTYELGRFMSKQLKLRDLRDYGLATYAEPKPLNQDEDNIASEYRDYDAWTIHRKRAWTTVMAGGHYDYIDFSIQNYLETGTPDSNRTLRTWFGVLTRFIHTVDLVRARPLPGIVTTQPAYTLDVPFGVAGGDVVVYLADARELDVAKFLDDDSAGRGPGAPINGTLTVDLTPGRYTVSTFDPKTGLSSPAITIDGGKSTTFMLPTFVHDIVIRFRRA